MMSSGFQSRRLSSAGFKDVFKAGIRFRIKGATVLINRNPLGQTHLGIVVAKKQVKLATARNRLKRLIKESFRRQHGHMQGYDFVIIARTELAQFEKGLVQQYLDKKWVHLVRLYEKQQ